MMNYLEKIKNSELMLGSTIILILTFIGNLLSYIFQFLMARMLGPADYVIIAIITSLIGIFAIPTLALQTLISKNTTIMNISNKPGSIKGMMKYLFKTLFWIATLFFTLFILISWPLSKKLGINYSYLFLTGFFIFGSFFYPILAGIVQGLKKFKDLGINFLINCSIKLGLGALLVLLGFRIYGAIIGFLAGTFISFLILFTNLREIISLKSEKHELNLFSKDNLYTFFAMLILVVIYSLDVIFSKIFFSSEMAGKYSVVSLIGKTILFVVASIGTAMFPINTEKFHLGHNTSIILKKVMAVSIFICSCALFLFWLMPEFIINILFGETYTTLSSLLIYMGITFSFFALLNLLVLYSISINRLKISEILTLLVILVLEIILFNRFNSTIESFAISFMALSVFGFFIMLALFITKNKLNRIQKKYEQN